MLIRCRVLVVFYELGALGWGHNMKFNMGLNMMDMVGVVHARLSDIKFPFIVLHDPKDGESSRRREIDYWFSTFFLSLRLMPGRVAPVKSRLVLILP